MKALSVFGCLLSAGQAVATLNCIAIRSTLVKRQCEFDACPAVGHATVGEILSADCLADCSTENDPWLKLTDGTYVRATSASVIGCRSGSEPYPVASKWPALCGDMPLRPKVGALKNGVNLASPS
ncbi:hypothetical protein MFIFM68171_03967 [Madurella fahalii]|uniref:Secreted protein n=1 Tax=Madurella fahalii TaxID=1157608 RepID=A0ABQ0G7N2_9PEZI